MAERATNIPVIPNVPVPVTDPLYGFLNAVKETIEVREGNARRGQVLDTYVLLRQLNDARFLSQSTQIATVTDSYGDPPAPPTGFTVTRGTWFNDLSWTNPTGDNFGAIQIWVNTVNDRSQASLFAIVTAPVQTYRHHIKTTTDDHYYWIRAVGLDGSYSTWMPTDQMGGEYVPGDESVGETIDGLLNVLRGGAPANYNGLTTYYLYHRVLLNGRTYRCLNDNAGAGITGISPPDPVYWERAGILMTGDVDGVPTVGIDGNLVVDDSILARSIYADYLSALSAFTGSLTVNDVLTVNEYGSIVVGNQNIALSGVTNDITISPDGGPTGQYYTRIGNDNLMRGYPDGSEYEVLARVELLTGLANNTNVVIPGRFKHTPTVAVFINEADLYDSSQSSQTQKVVCRHNGVSPTANPMEYQFTPIIQLESSDGSESQNWTDNTSATGSSGSLDGAGTDFYSTTRTGLNTNTERVVVSGRFRGWKEFHTNIYDHQIEDSVPFVRKYYLRAGLELDVYRNGGWVVDAARTATYWLDEGWVNFSLDSGVLGTSITQFRLKFEWSSGSQSMGTGYLGGSDNAQAYYYEYLEISSYALYLAGGSGLISGGLAHALVVGV